MRQQEQRKLKVVTGDYTFLMKRLSGETTPLRDVGPGNQRQGAWARMLAPGNTLVLGMDPRFAESLGKLQVRVTYLDSPEAAGSTFTVEAAGHKLTVEREGIGGWRVAVLESTQSQPADARVHIIPDGKPLILHMVEVAKP